MSTSESAQKLLREHRNRLKRVVGRVLATPPGTDDPPLSEAGRRYLLEELEELYWNDLEWENVTEEERTDGGALPELTFPGVLAMTRGLLLTEVAQDAPVGAEPRPEVVEEFMGFLARRVLELRDDAPRETEEGERVTLERHMTEGLLDRVLMEYHRVSPEDVGTLER